MINQLPQETKERIAAAWGNAEELPAIVARLINEQHPEMGIDDICRLAGQAIILMLRMKAGSADEFIKAFEDEVLFGCWRDEGNQVKTDFGTWVNPRRPNDEENDLILEQAVIHAVEEIGIISKLGYVKKLTILHVVFDEKKAFLPIVDCVHKVYRPVPDQLVFGTGYAEHALAVANGTELANKLLDAYI